MLVRLKERNSIKHARTQLLAFQATESVTLSAARPCTSGAPSLLLAHLHKSSGLQLQPAAFVNSEPVLPMCWHFSASLEQIIPAQAKAVFESNRHGFTHHLASSLNVAQTTHTSTCRQHEVTSRHPSLHSTKALRLKSHAPESVQKVKMIMYHQPRVAFCPSILFVRMAFATGVGSKQKRGRFVSGSSVISTSSSGTVQDSIATWLLLRLRLQASCPYNLCVQELYRIPS